MQKHTLRKTALGCLAFAAIACNQSPTEESPSQGPRASTSDDLIIHDQKNRRLLPAPGGDAAAKTAGWGSYFDASGKVEIRIWENTGSGQHNQVSVSVDNDYVLIGGGAWADYGSCSGGLLTANFPVNDQLTTWTGRSKDHLQTCPHTLHTYAIGMRLKDNSGAYLPRETVMQALVFRMNVGGQANHPSSQVTLPNGYKILSGGAEAVYTGAGSLLTASYPVSDQVWTGASKDHGTACPATMRTYAIGMTTGIIPGFGQMLIDVRPSLKVIDTEIRKVGSLSGNPSDGYLLAGIGAKTEYSATKGRLLFRMAPLEFTNQFFQVSSKDHAGREDAGKLYLSMVQIKKM